LSDRSSELAPLISAIRDVHAAMRRVDRECAEYLATISDEQQLSARNLLHYLALRSHDLRGAQPLLASMGLSWLGRTESYVAARRRNGLEGTPRTHGRLVGRDW